MKHCVLPSRPVWHESDDLQQRQIPWWIRAHRLVARPFRELETPIAGTCWRSRSGKGRVETEVFAEHALRDITHAKTDRAA